MVSYKFLLCLACLAAVSALQCPEYGTQAGGYRAADTDAVVMDGDVISAAFDAIDDYIVEAGYQHNSTACSHDDEDYMMDVTAACKQVVAGTNTIVEFTAVVCNQTVAGAIKVFTPLPAENMPSELVEYEIEPLLL